jgi:outer membrane protein assembly factor BamB
VTEEVVVVGSDLRRAGAVAHVYAFEKATGKMRWKIAFPFGVTTDIQRLGTNIYFATLADELVCLDLETGSPIWTFASGAPNDQFSLTSKPAVVADRVFFGDLDGGVTALDARSGAVVWKRALGGRISTSILAMESTLHLGTADRHLYRLSIETGAILADVTTDESPFGPVVSAADSILVFLGSKTLGCFDHGLKPRWVARSVADWTSSRPYVWRQTAIAGDETGKLAGLRLSDGARRWSRMLAGVIRGIGTSGDAFYVGTLEGTVYAIAPEK